MEAPSDQIESILNAALEIDSDAERREFVKQACGENADLLRRVEELIENHFHAGDFLEAPAITTATGSAEQPGTVIGPYKLLEQVGQGGFGVVFMAEQHQPVRRKVALKVLKPGMDTRQVVARFEAERQALALMEHPNIAQVFDGGETASGRPYFVMELVKGVPITKYCDDHHLSPRERLALFVPVCQAVQHAHQKGIIHRDIKPSNVLVGTYDGKPVPKVIDFGVAKALGQQLTERTLVTNFGGIIGTLEYMSPEQAEFNALDIDTRADIYGLGVLLYELLTGTTPLTKQRVKEAAITEVLRLIREEEPPTPSTRLSGSKDSLASISAQRKLEPGRLTKEVRGELDWIVMKCLEKERTRRYATANGLARDIERHLNDEPVEAGPPSATYKLRKFARKHRKLIGAAGAVALVLVAASVFSVWQAIRATRAQRTAVEEAGIAKAVTEFLQVDLLGQADIGNQSMGVTRNRDMTVRELLDRAAEGIEGRFPGQERTEAAIQVTLGMAYRAVGEYPQAHKHLERSFELRKTKSGANHLETVESMRRLAGLWRERGKLDVAEALSKEVYEALSFQLGSEHLETLRAVNDLAILDSLNGRHDTAESRYKQVIEGFRKALGPEHPQTLQPMLNLASLYSIRGQLEEAERIIKQVIDGLRASRGADHPQTILAMTNLGTIYLLARRYAEAEPLLRQALEVRRVKLGADHPDTLTTMNDLAFVYLESNQLDEAEPMFRQALNGSRVKAGENHPLTLKLMNGLATLSHHRGRHDEAEALFKQILKSRREALGANHPDTLLSINNLGAHYLYRREYDKAEPLFHEAFTGARERLGLNNVDTQDYIRNLLDVYRKKDAPHLAEALLRELAQSVRGQDGPDSLSYAGSLARLAQHLLEQKKFTETEAVLRDCLVIRQTKEPDAWTTFNSQSALGGALVGQKKYADAEPLLLQGYEGMKARESKMPASAKVRLIEALQRLVDLYDAWGKEAEAARWRKELADVKSQQKQQ